MVSLASLITSTAREAGPAPRLSILVPTFDRDVRSLCRELLSDIAALPDPRAAELLVLIDGNPALKDQEEVVAEAETAGLAAGLFPSRVNLGRAEARNALARLARGQFLLFLDADSLPDAPGFVARALEAAVDPAVVVCGGRTGKRMAPASSDALLFEAHSRRREWIPAEERNHDPAGNFLSANFMVGRDLFQSHPFDQNFKGWGWEDTEWALRVGSAARIRHVDNSVSHMEHHRDADWLLRLERSVLNYQRLYVLHPESVQRHRLFPLIRLLRPIGGWGAARQLLRYLALTHALPPRYRLMLLKFYQAMIYSSVRTSQPG
ncbi:MAG TPA: glycosyltransferase [Roseomonas sp.]